MYKLLILAMLAIATSAQSAGEVIDNGVEAEPEVECGSDAITINFNTASAFEGHVYVKGHYDTAECREDATLTQSASLVMPFSACDVRRQRSSNPLGLYISVTVVITFHPMFITMVDKAYNVQCFYMEADKQVTAELGVSLSDDQYQKVVVMLGGTDGDMHTFNTRQRNLTATDINELTTQVITQNVPMPTCTYQVLEGDANGAPVRFAAVGTQVYHKWNCGSNQPSEEPSAGIFCMTVHSCNVDNGQGRRVQLLDENGCATDRFLLNNLEYSDDVTAGQASMVFKYADQPTVFFQCQVRLTLKEDGTCKRTSDDCSSPVRGKRQAVDVDSNSVLTSDGEANVDVFSESITVFDLDTPTSESPLHGRRRRADGNALDAERRRASFFRADSSVLGELNRRARGEPSFCLSPVTFGLLMSVLATVLLTCVCAIGLLCYRHKRAPVYPTKYCS